MVKNMGVARLGASATATIMDDAYRRFGEASPGDASPMGPTAADSTGY